MNLLTKETKGGRIIIISITREAEIFQLKQSKPTLTTSLVERIARGNTNF